jgi:uncharacterized protein
MGSQPNVVGGSMKVDLRRVQEGTHPLVLDGRDAAFALDEDTERTLTGFRFEGEISSEGMDRRVCGSLTGTLETVCDRCLTRIDREVQADLDVRVVVEKSARDTESPEGVIQVASDTTVLDLTSPFRAAVLLEVPIKNLCRDDCRGICPRCGVNRNKEPCDCDPTPIDPRWDALRSAFETPSSETPEE